MRKNLLKRTDLNKPWLEHRLTVCIAHLEMPEFLFAVCQLWLLQTIKPFILVMDTGSTSKASQGLLEELESHPSIEVARLGIVSGVQHSSDRVAHAMDYGFSRCPTEFLLSTHLDLFVQRRDIAERMMQLCDAQTPVVGWEMSPRGAGEKGILNGSLSDGIPGHMLTMFHMPTMDCIGAGWSLRRGHHCFGLPREKNDISGWPDTEVCLGKVLEQNGIVPHLIGRETNASFQATEDWIHLRSATEKRLVHGGFPEQYLTAYQATISRIREWVSEDVKSTKRPLIPHGAGTLVQDRCHSLREHPDDPRVSLCAHPKVYVKGQVVSREICRICSFRDLPPPREFRRLPGGDAADEHQASPQSISILLLQVPDNTDFETTVQSLSVQIHQPSEVILVLESEGEPPDGWRSVLGRFQTRIIRPANGLTALESAIEAAHGDTISLLPVGTLLPSTFLEQGLQGFTSPQIGIVSSHDLNGDWDRLQLLARTEASHQNVVFCGCLIRRAAVFYSGQTRLQGMSQVQAAQTLIQDVIAAGWAFERHSSISSHPTVDAVQICEMGRQAQIGDHSFQIPERLTLFVPLSGRHRAWIQLSRFLERQTWPHERIRLFLLDTSHDHSFSVDVRKWLALSDYQNFTYQHMHVGLPRLADRDRTTYVDEVARATARIYSTAARESDTEFIWTLEDDVIPPDEAYERLISGFDLGCASVSGVYRARNGRTYSVWNSGNRLVSLGGTGLQMVEGNGLGCAVLRRHVLQDVAKAIASERTSFDAAFYKLLKSTGMTAKVDWSVECQHLVNSTLPH